MAAANRTSLDSSECMSSKQARPSFLQQIKLSFECQNARDAVIGRMNHAKYFLSPGSSMDNKQLLLSLLDRLEAKANKRHQYICIELAIYYSCLHSSVGIVMFLCERSGHE